MKILDLLNEEITQQDLLNHYNATITYEKLPAKINGFVFKYKGIYNVMINKNLSNSKKKKTIMHELAHVELNQLYIYENKLFSFYIDELEDEADRYINELYTIKEECKFD